MKYGDELNLIAYKIDEIKEDLKPIKDLDKRVARLERFTSMIQGVMWALVTGVPALYFIIKHLG